MTMILLHYKICIITTTIIKKEDSKIEYILKLVVFILSKKFFSFLIKNFCGIESINMCHCCHLKKKQTLTVLNLDREFNYKLN